MPPSPKPGGRRRKSKPRALELAKESAVPKAPEGMLKKTRDQWAAFWGSDVAAVCSPPTDLPALERLFSLYDERERCARAIRKSPLVTGSQGQPVLNPLSRQVGAVDPEIRQLEDRFGLTPMARLKLGVRFGQAAQSLDSLNDSLIHGDDEEETDPRLEVIDGSASDAG